MDKAILKKFAIFARNKLIQDIKDKALMIGITEKGIQEPLPQSTSDMLVFGIGGAVIHTLCNKEVKQYQKLRKEMEARIIKSDYTTVYDDLIEEVAYTWFHRLITIRFMEVNNYLPDKIRVLSSGMEVVLEPQLVIQYQDTSLDFTKEELEELAYWKLNGSPAAIDKLFQFLFIRQCNTLNKNLPDLFEKISDWAELLFPLSYTDSEGVLYRLIQDLPEEYFDIESENSKGQVEIIGWLYQYYHTEKKDKLISVVDKKVIRKQDIPVATQFFTPDWVVRYMVDNSLGRYWLERNPNSRIRDSLEYLLPGEISVIEEKISPEDLKVFDNAMGSGNCLSYTFDVLLKIYESEGYPAAEAAKLILERNLYGLDIDKRVYQLAYFVIMMKARKYNKLALSGKFKVNLKFFEDTATINKNHLNYLGLWMNRERREKALEQINYLIKEFENSTETGSILQLKDVDRDLILEFINEDLTEGQGLAEKMDIKKTQEQLISLIQIASILTERYDIMVTNPPYLNKLDQKLKRYINENYRDYKGDLFSVFIYRNLQLCKPNGYSAYTTPFVWMFIKTYEELRKYIIQTKHISSLIQMEYSAFEEATVPICAFVLRNGRSKERGRYIRLSDFTGGMEVQRAKTLEAIGNPECGYYYEVDQDNFKSIPGMSMAYWVNQKFVEIYGKSKPLSEVAVACVGLQTSDNNRFVRLWHEVNWMKIGFGMSSLKEARESKKKWFPYNKGGGFRRWYGNQEYLVNWENDGEEIKKYNAFLNASRRSSIGIASTQYYFKESGSWSLVSSRQFSVRFTPCGFIFDTGGSSVFSHDNIECIIALLNSKIATLCLQIQNPTLNFQPGNVGKIPYVPISNPNVIKDLVHACIKISKLDWDSFETSWNFKRHPLLNKDVQRAGRRIQSAYENWKQFANKNFNLLKTKEEEINRIFIRIYGLEKELVPDVSDRDITIHRIFDSKDEIYNEIRGSRYILTREDVIKSFISYAVGCMFGRYSLDVEGLVYAGGKWDPSKYKSFMPTEDNIILITDEEYFEQDMVHRFIDFVKITFGEETLEENLKFIADALGSKGEPRKVIRNYFLKDFYQDHIKTYQKRPIYWLYDSGKENGFKALIYVHRHDRDMMGQIRNNYLNEVQKIYEGIIAKLRKDISNTKDQEERARLKKRLRKITNQLKECKNYDEKLAQLAPLRIPIDLDNGIKVNYSKIETDEKGRNLKILSRIKNFKI